MNGQFYFIYGFLPINTIKKSCFLYVRNSSKCFRFGALFPQIYRRFPSSYQRFMGFYRRFLSSYQRFMGFYRRFLSSPLNILSFFYHYFSIGCWRHAGAFFKYPTKVKAIYIAYTFSNFSYCRIAKL